MNIDKLVLRFAGFLVLVSLALGYWLSPYWFWLTAFVGANMLRSSFTGFCPLAKILAKMKVKAGAAFTQ